MAGIDSQQFRAAMGQFCTGVVAVTACLEGEPVGFAAQSFVSLSLDPPLVSLSPAKTSTSWPKIRDSGSFCVNMLAADQRSVCDAFARSGGDKFAGFEWHAGSTGSPILTGVLAYADCDLEAEHDAGDHTIAIGRVRDLELVREGEPLLFFRGAYGSFGPLESTP
jgi:flavin reductase (DIM6/NTAB) family NADH-FMN oxidoreductase RutF